MRQRHAAGKAEGLHRPVHGQSLSDRWWWAEYPCSLRRALQDGQQKLCSPPKKLRGSSAEDDISEEARWCPGLDPVGNFQGRDHICSSALLPAILQQTKIAVHVGSGQQHWRGGGLADVSSISSERCSFSSVEPRLQKESRPTSFSTVILWNSLHQG